MADTAPKPFVFVLMPFANDFEDAYRLAIRPAAEAPGAYCEAREAFPAFAEKRRGIALVALSGVTASRESRVTVGPKT